MRKHQSPISENPTVCHPCRFINALFIERHDFAQRILAQRKMLFESWNGSFCPENTQIMFENSNLSHLRDHLMCTVNLEVDGVNEADPECIPTDEYDCIPSNAYEDELKKGKEMKELVLEEEDDVKDACA